MEAILKRQNAIRWRPWLLILDGGAKLLLRWRHVEAASFGRRAGHKGELVGAFDCTRAAHSCLHAAHTCGSHIHECLLDKFIPVFWRIETEGRAISIKHGHSLALGQLKHLRLVVAESTRGDVLDGVKVHVAIAVGQVVSNGILKVNREVNRQGALLLSEVAYEALGLGSRHLSLDHRTIGLTRELCHCRELAHG